jgi:hypothetical protein
MYGLTNDHESSDDADLKLRPPISEARGPAVCPLRAVRNFDSTAEHMERAFRALVVTEHCKASGKSERPTAKQVPRASRWSLHELQSVKRNRAQRSWSYSMALHVPVIDWPTANVGDNFDFAWGMPISALQNTWL